MYKVVIDELVIEEDFRKIGIPGRRKILKAIRSKLTKAPDKFGAPLKGPLKGCWKLRVGEYRVVYEIQKEKVVVYVIVVGFRRNKEAYKQALKREGL